jgi:lipopolysaccharide export system protein LptC
MPDIIKAWGFPLFAGFAAIASFWLLLDADNDVYDETKEDFRAPDYSFEEMNRRTGSKLGGLKNVLDADLVEHFPKDDSMELVRPYLKIYNDSDEPWHIKSETGWVSSGNEVILLHGEVEIWKNGKNRERILQALTTELRILPNQEYAETDNTAIIIGPSSVTHALGFRANFSLNHLELIERVRTKHSKKSLRVKL